MGKLFLGTLNHRPHYAHYSLGVITAFRSLLLCPSLSLFPRSSPRIDTAIRSFEKMLQATVHSNLELHSIPEHPHADTYQDLQDPALPAHHRQSADLESHLVVSPYTTPPHLLDLRSLNEPQTLLAKALTVLQSTREDYATAPYDQSFNWAAVTARLQSLITSSNHHWKRQHFYIVVFRSQVPPTTDRTHLGALDQRSHAEATKSGGLLKYWFGLPDKDGRNLATCTFPNLPLLILSPPIFTLTNGLTNVSFFRT